MLGVHVIMEKLIVHYKFKTMKPKQPKLKVGQKYRVIKDISQIGTLEVGSIVTVNKILSKTNFEDKNRHIMSLKYDKLELIQPKTKLSKSPRQFRLLKNTPEFIKDSIFTYDKESKQYLSSVTKTILLNNQGILRTFTYDKKVVENNPEWFEEMFDDSEPIKTNKIEKISKEEIMQINLNNGSLITKLYEKQCEIIDKVNSLDKQ